MPRGTLRVAFFDQKGTRAVPVDRAPGADLPFTRAEFFEVFRAYNVAVWPAQWLLAAAGVLVLVCVGSRRDVAARVAMVLLAALWLWMAVAYHLLHFWRVNPAAPAFALLSAGGAALLLWGGLRSRPPRFAWQPSPRSIVGLSLACYGLIAYPLLNPLFGHSYPAAPGFGLPCPTTVFTIGVLSLAEPSLPRVLLMAPALWSVVGATAAVVLDVPQDYVLGLAGLWAFFLVLRPGSTSTGSVT